MAGGNVRRKGDGKGRQGGRQKGTPNKSTVATRAMLSEIIESKYEEFKKRLDTLNNKEFCRAYIDLLAYVAPKMANIEYKDKTEAKSFRDELDEISEEKTREMD